MQSALKAAIKEMPAYFRSSLKPAGFVSAAFAAWAAAVALAAAPAFAQRPPETSSWVWRDQVAGRLLYRTTPVGDRIPDFSGSGYMGSARPVPDVNAIIPANRRVTVEPPAQGDAGRAIQAAIEKIAASVPASNGFRGLIQLTPGIYDIDDQIMIEASGIILRGTPTTKLRGIGTKKRSLIVVGRRTGGRDEVPDTRSEVTDAYVPVGVASLRVREPWRFKPGDAVVVFRPATPAWINAIGMDRIPPPRGGGTLRQWKPAGPFDQHYERTVERIEGDRLFLDAPLTNSLDRAYGPAYVYRYSFPDRIEQVGLIELHAESTYDPSMRDQVGREVDENHAGTFIDVDRVRNAWIDRISARHFGYSAVILRTHASQVTVRHAASYAPVSLVIGQRRYAFTNDGQRNLMHDLFSEFGRHDFANNVPSRGPNVFLRGHAVNSSSETGPHQRWSTGTLFDRIDVSGTGASLAAHNAGSRGTGHGHSGANMVFWNSSAPRLIVQNPPTAQNWVVGSKGLIIDRNDFLRTPAGNYDRHGIPASLGDARHNPEHSLFVAQQAERARLADRNEVRRSYPSGDYAAGADAHAKGAAQLTLAVERNPDESVRSAIIRFAARRGGAGAPAMTVGGEPLQGPVLVTDDTRDIVTGTGILPATALGLLNTRGAVVISAGSHLRLLWVEAEIDFLPARTSAPAPRTESRSLAVELQ